MHTSTNCLRTLVISALFALSLPVFAESTPMAYPEPDVADPTGVLPKLISRVEPILPASLAGQSIDEDVCVAFIVNAKGVPTKVHAFFSRHDELEAPAIEAVKQWKFTPGQHQGRLVSTQMIVAVHFGPSAKTP